LEEKAAMAMAVAVAALVMAVRGTRTFSTF